MSFSPKLNILPESQRALWKELKATPKHCVHYGGAALAIRLGHRVSEDFDFFTNATFEPQGLVEGIPCLPDGKVTLQREKTLTLALGPNRPVSTSFFGVLPPNPPSHPATPTDHPLPSLSC